uniref:CSON013034 protein n=1 Tax=Culicoides sonorensis TaxID=179676 RepID=A0A336MCB0_CULSO
MTRHRKFLKAEKAKTKLKGHKLPKGLNTTKTEFKVRKIVIPEQLKDKSSSNQALSRKLYNVKECLIRLGHNNPQQRAEALRNLKDIIESRPKEVLDQHFSTILKGISEMSVDIERDNRREACRVLNIILMEATKFKSDGTYIEPFFNILCSYLRCAMTHIAQSIQEDSLLFLDVLMTHVPKLVAANRDKIIPSYMDMISKLRSEAKPERTLTVHLGSKITGVKWRIKVLERLCSLFVAINAEKRREKLNIVEEVKMTKEENVFESDFDNIPLQMPVNYFHPEKNFCFPITASHFEVCPSLSNLGDNTTSKYLTESDQIQSYIDLIIPLMIETWLEVRPTINQFEKTGTTITNESAYTLKLLLQVIQQLQISIELWEKQEKTDKLSKYLNERFFKDFEKNFLINVGFPFNQIDHRSDIIQKRNTKCANRELMRSGDQNCYIQNLLICDIYSRSIFTSENLSRESFPKVLIYLKQCVCVWEKLSLEASSQLNIVLKSVFLSPKSTGVKDLLKSLIALYMNPDNSIRKEIKTQILMLLCNILLDNAVNKKVDNDIFQQWIQSLPDLLLGESCSYKVLNVIIHLCRQLNKNILLSLEHKMLEIVKNLFKIKVIGAADEKDGKTSIASLVYWIKNEKKLEEIQDLLKKLDKVVDDKETVNYLKELLQNRLICLRSI